MPTFVQSDFDIVAYSTTNISSAFSEKSIEFLGNTKSQAVSLDEAWLNSLGLTLDGEFSLVFRKTVRIPTSGTYWFRIGSDDGICLFVNGSLVINANDWHPVSNEFGRVDLEKGLASIELRYFQSWGAAALQAHWRPPDAPDWEVIP